eukprot:CAMPEP_0197642132 /NCGR_PEP_ID=MMETSP1338-20131121/15886_1 /TAXON_ID=43686 ORGANISM="Pelagodinium beii, Strain RCC1491" /NCGR_SAMPLE_ID=MMETSP1338 /ASSEMBLY_ACC=CAM_ASM_000754 /LENGTH=231 /DNA_ID=CAMNT_0043215215 /DNA_START=79 /DNA_END=774 /DNA_ORIENTATION=+
MPLTNSSGFTPSSKALRSQSQSDLTKLFYSSAASTAFTGRQLGEADRNESMSEVHAVGQRDTKYLPFRYSTTRLIDRTSCRYTQELCARPLGDHLGNFDFAASMKDLDSSPMGPDRKNNSLHADSWRNFSKEEMLEAKPALKYYTMAKTSTLNDMGKKMDPMSFNHFTHNGRSEAFCNSGTIETAKDNLIIGQRGGVLRAGDCYRSRYGTDYWNYSFSGQAEKSRPQTGLM